MIMMHCTYPDGSTSEARFTLPLAYLMSEMEWAAMGGTWPDWPIYERTLCTKSMEQTCEVSL